MSLDEIRERVENAPRLLVDEANDFTNASVYEEEDGLETLALMPVYYSDEAQNAIARDIVAAYEDRARLLAALDNVISGLAEYELEDGARDMANYALKKWKPREY